MLQFETPGSISSVASRHIRRAGTRYPWLEMWLSSIRAGAAVTFFIGIGAAILMVVRAYNSDPHGFPYSSPALVAGAVIVALVAFWDLMVAFALTELVRVIIDIETNTRSAAQQRPA
jgi:hypothetical protein